MAERHDIDIRSGDRPRGEGYGLQLIQHNDPVEFATQLGLAITKRYGRGWNAPAPEILFSHCLVGGEISYAAVVIGRPDDVDAESQPDEAAESE